MISAGTSLSLGVTVSPVPLAYDSVAVRNNRQRSIEAVIFERSATRSTKYWSGVTGPMDFFIDLPQSKKRTMPDYLPSENFLLRDRQAVYKFLSHNNDLVDILVDSLEAIKPIFGDHIKIAVSYFEDPELIGFKQLVAKIQVYEDVQGALTKLDSFDDVWLLDHSDLIGNRLSFNLEYL